MQNNTQVDTPATGVEEEGTRLYLAHYEGPAKVNDAERSIQVDIVIAGRPGEEGFLVHEVRRFALRTESLDELKGPLSLAGPVDHDKFDPVPAWSLECSARLYYRALDDLEPAYVEHDAVYPRLEKLRGTLGWEFEAVEGEDMALLRISLLLVQPVDASLGLVWLVELVPREALLFRALQEGGEQEKRANSLTACGSAAPAGNDYDCRALNVRFYSVSEDVSLGALHDLAQEWIESACRLWWERGGFKIVPYPDIDQHHFPTGPGETPGEIPLGRETGIVDPLRGGINRGTPPTHIAVFLADVLDPMYWGGVTFAAGTDQAYVLLEIERARNSKFLLAHELGHVLGVAHPNATSAAVWPGSYCSVMLPDRPVSSRNTATNTCVIEETSPPLAPPVFQTLLQATDRDPDAEQGYFHLVRDLPYDDGAPTLALEDPFTDWWTCSDVWNSDQGPEQLPGKDQFQPATYLDGSALFAPDHSPIHTEPTRCGPNWMYVRLHTCQPLAAPAPPPPVNVYLYLTVPGASNAPLIRLGAGPNADLVFSGFAFPSPSLPKTNWIQWNVPSGYPAHCCVFAVAVSSYQPTPAAIANVVANPGAHNFYHLFGLLKATNDVAQRNLHVQNCTPPAGSSLRSMLPWLHVANPREQAATARVEIDTGQARELQALDLELDGKAGPSIEIGGTMRVEIAENLLPGDGQIVRLQATLPPDAAPGTTFAIDLRFFMDDELVAGYRHVLRVAPLDRTVRQVMDALCGALRDVQAGYSVATEELVNQVRSLIAAAAADPKGALADLRARAALFAALAKDVEAVPLPREEGQSVHGHLAQLADLLAAPNGAEAPDEGWDNLPASLSPGAFAERLRELADRIQEPAGRRARQAA